MILTSVYVPSMDRDYDFNLDENSKISVLIEEISELICKKEHSVLDGKSELFVMGSIDRQTNFQPQYTLKELNVKNGERLILL